MTPTAPGNDHPLPLQLSAFVDGELPSDEALEIQRHLADCHACALQVLSATQLKAATARAAQRFAPPAAALQRLASQLTPEEAKKPVRPRFGYWAWAAVAAVLITAVSFAGWRQVKRSNTLTAELLDQHLTVLSSGALPEVVSTDRHTVKPWFQGKLPFSFNLPETLPSDTVLKGADFTFLRGQPAALLLFTIHKHEVSVFLIQRSGNDAALGVRASRSGFSVREASTQNLLVFAVSDVDPTALEQLVKSLKDIQSSL